MFDNNGTPTNALGCLVQFLMVTGMFVLVVLAYKYWETTRWFAYALGIGWIPIIIVGIKISEKRGDRKKQIEKYTEELTKVRDKIASNENLPRNAWYRDDIDELKKKEESIEFEFWDYLTPRERGKYGDFIFRDK